jgi:hypothetical protein
VDSKKSQKRSRIQREIAKQKVREAKVMQGFGDIPSGAGRIGRLQYVPQEFDYDADTVASALRFSPGGVCFCDATVFIGPTPSQIWDAMTEQNRVAIIPAVLLEIRHWLDGTNDVNKAIRSEVRTALKSESGGRIFVPARPGAKWIDEGMWYYANLLGTRKLAWPIVEGQLAKELNRAPTPHEISNFIQKLGTSRAQLLAKQGRNPKVPENIFNDEWLVALALGHAIVCGIETTIVTSDEAVFDQYVKATLLLTCHYEAMHLADQISRHPQRFSVETIANPDPELFSGPTIDLVRGPVLNRADYLPSQHTSVQIHCMLLQEKVTRYTFQAEQEMRDVLRLRHATNGLCTDALDGRNLHVVIPGAARSKKLDYVLIASDMTVDAGGPIPIALADVEAALRNEDQFQDIKWVDSRVLLLPSRFYRGESES